MTQLLVLLVVGGLTGFLVWIFKSIEKLGVKKEQLAQREQQDAVLRKANEVLAEQRDTSDAVERLRKHDF